MSEQGTRTMKQNPLQYVSDQLQELRTKGVAPKLRVLEGGQKPVAPFEGRELTNIAWNNYLGLTPHKGLRKAAVEPAKNYGAGAGPVRTIAGTMQLQMQLKSRLQNSRT